MSKKPICKRPGLTLVAEMPAKVMSLETIGDEVFAVLKGGATIPLSSLVDPERAKTVQ